MNIQLIGLLSRYFLFGDWREKETEKKKKKEKLPKHGRNRQREKVYMA